MFMSEVSAIRHKNVSSLNPQDQLLLNSAEQHQQLAYAPYSGFLVGAAVLTGQEHIVAGANQENASYPLCMCGERVALYNCAILHPGDTISVIAIVVKGRKPLSTPATPCGACLQVIREFEVRQNDQPIRLLLKADGDEVWEFPSAQTLLPYSFDGAFLR